MQANPQQQTSQEVATENSPSQKKTLEDEGYQSVEGSVTGWPKHLNQKKANKAQDPPGEASMEGSQQGDNSSQETATQVHTHLG